MGILTYLKLGGFVILLLVIAGFVAYHFIDHAALESQINALTIDNKTLADNNAKLLAANSADEQTIKAQSENFDKIQMQMQLIAQADNDNRDAINALQNKMDNPAWEARLTAAMKGDQGATLLDYINKDNACYAAHVKETGQCIQGKWYPGHISITTPASSAHH